MGFRLGAGLVLAGGVLCVLSVISLFADPIYDIEGNCYKCGDPSIQLLIVQLVASLAMAAVGMIMMWRDNLRMERKSLVIVVEPSPWC